MAQTRIIKPTPTFSEGQDTKDDSESMSGLRVRKTNPDDLPHVCRDNFLVEAQKDSILKRYLYHLTNQLVPLHLYISIDSGSHTGSQYRRYDTGDSYKRVGSYSYLYRSLYKK